MLKILETPVFKTIKELNDEFTDTYVLLTNVETKKGVGIYGGMMVAYSDDNGIEIIKLSAKYQDNSRYGMTHVTATHNPENFLGGAFA